MKLKDTLGANVGVGDEENGEGEGIARQMEEYQELKRLSKIVPPYLTEDTERQELDCVRPSICVFKIEDFYVKNNRKSLKSFQHLNLWKQILNIRCT